MLLKMAEALNEASQSLDRIANKANTDWIINGRFAASHVCKAALAEFEAFLEGK